MATYTDKFWATWKEAAYIGAVTAGVVLIGGDGMIGSVVGATGALSAVPPTTIRPLMVGLTSAGGVLLYNIFVR